MRLAPDPQAVPVELLERQTSLMHQSWSEQPLVVTWS